MPANGWADDVTGWNLKNSLFEQAVFANSNGLFYLNHNDKNIDVIREQNEMPVKPFIFVSTRAFKRIQPFILAIKLSGVSGFFLL